MTSDSIQTAEYIAQAIKIAPRNPDIYMLKGDIAASHKLWGEASEFYQQALYFDPDCRYATLKYADIYARINPQIAIEAVKQLLVKDPQSLIAVRELAELYYKDNRIGEALEMYKRYIESPYATFDDRAHYAAIVFFAGDFEKSYALTEELLKQNPNDFRVQRLLMYNLFELKKYDRVSSVATQFMVRADGEHISNDYLYYGEILAETKLYDLAKAALTKAYELDSTLVEALRDLATVAVKTGDYEDAIKMYRMFVTKGGKKVQTKDLLAFGRAYYLAAAGMDSLDNRRIEYANSAVKLFEKVITAAPNSYLGYFWQARTSVMFDPESTAGIAKPYYEKSAQLLENSANTEQLIECYKYLGYYYFLKNDIAQSKVYWNKILVLDSQNEIARKALEGMK